jgi:hypothetical protein
MSDKDPKDKPSFSDPNLDQLIRDLRSFSSRLDPIPKRGAYSEEDEQMARFFGGFGPPKKQK